MMQLNQKKDEKPKAKKGAKHYNESQMAEKLDLIRRLQADEDKKTDEALMEGVDRDLDTQVTELHGRLKQLLDQLVDKI